MINKRKWIKIIGMLTIVVGSGIDLVTDWVNEQKINDMIDDKIKEALSNQETEEES